MVSYDPLSMSPVTLELGMYAGHTSKLIPLSSATLLLSLALLVMVDGT